MLHACGQIETESFDKMRLTGARVQNYRSIVDSGWFNIENLKTILVGPNEAGKTVILRALEQINPAKDVPAFKPLRDYPRSKYNADIQSRRLNPSDIPVVSAKFSLEEEDKKLVDEMFLDAEYIVTRFLDNHIEEDFKNGTDLEVVTDNIFASLERLASHVDKDNAEGGSDRNSVADILRVLISMRENYRPTNHEESLEFVGRMLSDLEFDIVREHLSNVEEYRRLTYCLQTEKLKHSALKELHERLPKFVYFDSYFQVHPNIHLQFLADRVDLQQTDTMKFDYGNLCLLKLLGFSARDLSDLALSDIQSDDHDSFEEYRTSLDERDQQLNAASVRLTNEIKRAWRPDPRRAEAATLRLRADGQYLKVVVEDDLGIEIELDQRSAGYQWLVSFFVVFFAETDGKHKNAILLLDEPGLSLHGLKQREFRSTISELAEKNQTLYTTHSPFLVGPDELGLVRVVELTDRGTGTIVHQNVIGNDPAAIFALQVALGYDLAQSLFMHRKNLVLEGLTDYWYFDSTTRLLAADGESKISEKISLVPAGSASKIAYLASILCANKLNVAALIDSDNAGNMAAQQEILVSQLGNKKIIRTSDVCQDDVDFPEIEDLLRHTLSRIAKEKFDCDVTDLMKSDSTHSINWMFKRCRKKSFKYDLAKAYLNWASNHQADDLEESERVGWQLLIKKVNKALK